MKTIQSIILCLSIYFVVFTIQAQPNHFKTEKGTLKMHPIFHSSIIFEWNDLHIYVDPYGGWKRYEDFPKPNIVLITHPHGDHMNLETLRRLDLSKATLIAPVSVVEELTELKFKTVIPLKINEEIDLLDLKVEALPMYNLPENEESRHKKGWGNGYVMTIGGKRIYICGDTEDISEMRNLRSIDVAFICMNKPTMTLTQAVDAVLAFKPSIVYPFHYRSGDNYADINQFKKEINLNNSEIEVRLRDWYPKVEGQGLKK